jgi:hypothetical protein
VKDVNEVGLEELKKRIINSPVYNHLRIDPRATYDNNGVKL